MPPVRTRTHSGGNQRHFPGRRRRRSGRRCGARAAPPAVQHLPGLPGAPGSRGQRWPGVKGLSPAGLGRLFSAPLLLSVGRRGRAGPAGNPGPFPRLSRVCGTEPRGGRSSGTAPRTRTGCSSGRPKSQTPRPLEIEGSTSSSRGDGKKKGQVFLSRPHNRGRYLLQPFRKWPRKWTVPSRSPLLRGLTGGQGESREQMARFPSGSQGGQCRDTAPRDRQRSLPRERAQRPVGRQVLPGSSGPAAGSPHRSAPGQPPRPAPGRLRTAAGRACPGTAGQGGLTRRGGLPFS